VADLQHRLEREQQGQAGQGEAASAAGLQQHAQAGGAAAAAARPFSPDGGLGERSGLERQHSVTVANVMYYQDPARKVGCALLQIIQMATVLHALVQALVQLFRRQQWEQESV
jgi:hypothetical protein